MISRVAECCFWMMRHLERAESLARLLTVNRGYVMDAGLEVVNRWMPFVIVVGEQERFEEMHGEGPPEGELVEQYLVWEERNPVSLYRCLEWSRENARRIREVISEDFWESLNELWLWVESEEARVEWAEQREDFYHHVIRSCQMIYGVLEGTMSHNEAYQFIQIGTFIERAGQTARILDVKYHSIGPSGNVLETAYETAEWLALLRSCSAHEPYLKERSKPLSGVEVANFLLFNRDFPRSVRFCLERTKLHLNAVREAGGVGQSSIALLRNLVARIESGTMSEVLQSGLHQELTDLVELCAEFCSELSRDYFLAPEPV